MQPKVSLFSLQVQEASLFPSLQVVAFLCTECSGLIYDILTQKKGKITRNYYKIFTQYSKEKFLNHYVKCLSQLIYHFFIICRANVRTISLVGEYYQLNALEGFVKIWLASHAKEREIINQIAFIIICSCFSMLPLLFWICKFFFGSSDPSASAHEPEMFSQIFLSSK